MIEFVTRSLTFFIPSKKLRTKYRIKLKTLYYARIMLHKAKSIGKNFVAGGYCECGKNTIIGNFVRLNGMRESGGGVPLYRRFCSLWG